MLTFRANFREFEDVLNLSEPFTIEQTANNNTYGREFNYSGIVGSSIGTSLNASERHMYNSRKLSEYFNAIPMVLPSGDIIPKEIKLRIIAEMHSVTTVVNKFWGPKVTIEEYKDLIYMLEFIIPRAIDWPAIIRTNNIQLFQWFRTRITNYSTKKYCHILVIDKPIDTYGSLVIDIINNPGHTSCINYSQCCLMNIALEFRAHNIVRTILAEGYVPSEDDLINVVYDKKWRNLKIIKMLEKALTAAGIVYSRKIDKNDLSITTNKPIFDYLVSNYIIPRDILFDAEFNISNEIIPPTALLKLLEIGCNFGSSIFIKFYSKYCSYSLNTLHDNKYNWDSYRCARKIKYKHAHFKRMIDYVAPKDINCILYTLINYDDLLLFNYAHSRTLDISLKNINKPCLDLLVRSCIASNATKILAHILPLTTSCYHVSLLCGSTIEIYKMMRDSNRIIWRQFDLPLNLELFNSVDTFMYILKDMWPEFPEKIPPELQTMVLGKSCVAYPIIKVLFKLGFIEIDFTGWVNYVKQNPYATLNANAELSNILYAFSTIIYSNDIEFLNIIHKHNPRLFSEIFTFTYNENNLSSFNRSLLSMHGHVIRDIREDPMRNPLQVLYLNANTQDMVLWLHNIGCYCSPEFLNWLIGKDHITAMVLIRSGRYNNYLTMLSNAILALPDEDILYLASVSKLNIFSFPYLLKYSRLSRLNLLSTIFPNKKYVCNIKHDLTKEVTEWMLNNCDLRHTTVSRNNCSPGFIRYVKHAKNCR